MWRKSKVLLESAENELQNSTSRAKRIRRKIGVAEGNTHTLAMRREENGFARSLRIIFEGAQR